MISKNKFSYETHQDALDALNKSLNWDFEWELEEINLWIREFLRDTPNDNEWLNIVINNFGCNCSAIKLWFINE